MADSKINGPAPGRALDPSMLVVAFNSTGGAPIQVPMFAIEAYVQYGIRTSINFGSQVGASVAVLVVMLMLLKPEKLRSPIVVLNGIALVLNVVRTVLECLFFTGPWFSFYAVFSGDYSRVPQSSYNISCTLPPLVVILLITIETSLILQVRAVCVTASRMHRLWIMLVSIAVAMVAVGFRFAHAIENTKSIRTAENTIYLAWLSSSVNITTTASISFFSAIFVAKLVIALRQRRKLGLRQFGPMQVIIIMGSQTMIVPVIFAGVQYLPNSIELFTQVLTVTAIFLPLSSIWASATIESQKPVRHSGDFRGKQLVRSSTRYASDSDTKQSTSTELDSTSLRLSTSAAIPAVMTKIHGGNELEDVLDRSLSVTSEKPVEV